MSGGWSLLKQLLLTLAFESVQGETQTICATLRDPDPEDIDPETLLQRLQEIHHPLPFFLLQVPCPLPDPRNQLSGLPPGTWVFL